MSCWLAPAQTEERAQPPTANILSWAVSPQTATAKLVQLALKCGLLKNNVNQIEKVLEDIDWSADLIGSKAYNQLEAALRDVQLSNPSIKIKK